MEKAIASVFYHPRNGFKSVEGTYKDVNKIDKTITREHVRHFIKNQEVRQRRKPIKVNSFVADFPRQEFQVDLADFGERAKTRYGFCAIDIFSKKTTCIPIGSKVATDTAAALAKTFSELGYPVSIMCDEGGEFGAQFAELAQQNEVELVKSRTGGRFVERFIRTLKKALFDRTQSLKGTWNSHLQNVLDQYNESVHSSTKLAPDYVATHEYDKPVVDKAWANMSSKAKFPVSHEPIAVGDSVKIRVKPSGYSDHKETFNSWSDEVYVVDSIDHTHPQGTIYQLRGYRRALLRFELKKVHDVQRMGPEGLHSVLPNVTVGATPPAVPAGPSRSTVPAPAPIFRSVTRSLTAGGSSSSASAPPAAILRSVNNGEPSSRPMPSRPPVVIFKRTTRSMT